MEGFQLEGTEFGGREDLVKSTEHRVSKVLKGRRHIKGVSSIALGQLSLQTSTTRRRMLGRYRNVE